MRRIRSRCYARAASGQAAAPPSSVMNSRRFIRSPRRLWRASQTARTSSLRAACPKKHIASSIGVHALDQPGAWRGARRATPDHGRAVQEPKHYLSRARVEPEDVAFAVAVEIASFGNRPGARRRTGRTTADHGGAIEKPDHCCPRGAAEPEDVARPVAVEVAGAGHRPRASRRTGRTTADHRGAIKQPDHRLAGAGVVPEDVGPTVAVEVAGAG